MGDRDFGVSMPVERLPLLGAAVPPAASMERLLPSRAWCWLWELLMPWEEQ